MPGRAFVVALGFVLAPAAFGQDDPGVRSTLERTGSASGDEMRAYAADAVEEIEDALRQLRTLQRGMGQGASAESSECVSGNVTSASSLEAVVRAAARNIEALLLEGTPAALQKAQFEFRKIAIALEKARDLQNKTERCASLDALTDGSTSVNVEGALTGDDADTEAPANNDSEVGFDPPDVSPF